MSDVQTWDATAANNNSAPPNGWPEGMQYSEVNNSARENMAAIARWYQDTNGSLVTAGASNTYTLTSNRTISAYADGIGFAVRANHTNTGAATLNVNAIGAKDIVAPTGAALGAGQITEDGIYEVVYVASTDQFVLLGAVGGAISGTTGTFTGAVSAASFAATGAVTGASATLTGAISGGTVAGDMRASDAEIEARSATDKLVTPAGLGHLIQSATVSANGIEGGTISTAHGLGDEPTIFGAHFVNTSSEGGFTSGQKMAVSSVGDASGDYEAILLFADGTNISARGFSGLEYVNKSGISQPFNDANWSIEFWWVP